MATHEMTLDVDKSVALAAEVVTARTGDTGTVIKATILKDGSPISDATSARFLAIRPDRTYIEQTASISGGTATVTLDPRALAVPGSSRRPTSWSRRAPAQRPPPTSGSRS